MILTAYRFFIRVMPLSGFLIKTFSGLKGWQVENLYNPTWWAAFAPVPDGMVWFATDVVFDRVQGISKLITIRAYSGH